MKNLVLIIAIAAIFTSCKKEEVGCQESLIVTDPNLPEYGDCIDSEDLDEFEQTFNLAYEVNRGGDIEIDSTTANISVFSYPTDNYWEVIIYSLPNADNNNYPGAILHTLDGTGAFDINLIANSINASQDTIYGSGYFDLDTFYVNYQYQNLEDPTLTGTVNMHSY